MQLDHPEDSLSTTAPLLALVSTSGQSLEPKTPRLFDELIEQILSWIHPSKVFRFRRLCRIFDVRIVHSLHFARLNLARFVLPRASRNLSSSAGLLTEFDKLFMQSWPQTYQYVYASSYLTGIKRIQWPRMDKEGVTIPESLGKVVSLKQLDFTESKIVGEIPVELFKLTKLEFLSLAVNQLTGCLPKEIGNLTHLTHLYLETNDFEGTIPVEIGNLTSLINLFLHSSNITGPIPREIGNLTKLERLTLRHNKLSGPLPLELFTKLGALKLLYLYGNSFTGPIPNEIGLLARLRQLKMSSNRFEGVMPRELLELGLVECDFRFNPGLKCDFLQEIPRAWQL
ncbi:hypothetical protein HDU98_003280 [Podochytrium sp. JEL0797]|nr:hypothetical protein HDU98_003280 [Podochytrium sp. JEL0797]